MDAAPVLGANCRFTPSCSEYAIEALRRHGALRGGALAAWRVLRCNPWVRAAYDPVPPCSCSPQRPADPLMDQNRLFLAIAISVAIMLGFQLLLPHPKACRTRRPAPNETTLNHAPTPAARARPARSRRRPARRSAAAAAALRRTCRG